MDIDRAKPEMTTGCLAEQRSSSATPK